ncbi:MAG: Uncharacterized protein G01um101419_486 [Parcubacteria group bacterium Gr01-1014_19]|nr:MAG: Uncharacterized protein G01um101419_486 [Parcubacteria group bacterium Gr01-1014_19]
MPTNYLRMEYLLAKIDEPNRRACEKLYHENRKLWEKTPGSSHNHQSWPGGYVDHVIEVMNVALALHESLGTVRPLPFSLSDALLVLFIHDLEKPWKYEMKANGQADDPSLQTKEQRHNFRLAKATEYGIALTEEHKNGIKYAEGELNDYSSKKRVMSPLAAFAHMCDVCSARIWHDHPKENSDLWIHAKRWRS